MTKKLNGYNWEGYEQKRKELQADDDGEGVLDVEGGEERSDVETEGGTADGQDDRDGGKHDVREHTPAYSGADLGLSTPIGRIIHDKEVRDKIGSFVDFFLQYAAKDKYPIPPGMPDAGHEFIVVERKVLVWLMSHLPMTTIQFAFSTTDDIPCQCRQTMEQSDLPEVKKQMESYITNQRRQKLWGARVDIVH